MFTNIPIGKQNPLERKQLKWLLIVFAALLMVLTVYVAINSMRSSLSDSGQQNFNEHSVQVKPTEEEIRKQLDILAEEDAKNQALKPSEEEIRNQLEVLAEEDAKNQALQPSEEEIRKQLEVLAR